MLVTDDAALADRARTMRLHGIGRDAWKRYTAAGSWYYEIEAAGFKDNLTDLAAAIGLVQLERAAELRAARAAIARALPRRPGRTGGATGASSCRRRRRRPGARLAPVRDPARSRGAAGDGESTSTCRRRRPAARAATARVAAGPRDRRARRGRASGSSVHFIPLHLHPLYQRMGYRAGPVPGRRGGLRRRDQPADLARDDRRRRSTGSIDAVTPRGRRRPRASAGRPARS